VTYEGIGGTHGDVVRDMSLYDALRHLTGPFIAVEGGFQETAPRHLPTHAGKLTPRRTLLVPAGMTDASVRRLARYLLRERHHSR